MKIPEIVPVSDFRRDAAAVLQKVQASPDPVVLTQRGRSVAVLQSVEAYERTQRDLALARALLAGEADVAAGRVRADGEVLAEARALLDRGHD
ncbi:MAG: type II toxin-antitoxin system Phd/YefM family antitoxin [Krumholzibacteria bacterium]|nr:type II toxin-antitoxin system Phd/YefM family antitoxin [Candidatus Krumholzibacteria bacterium]